MSSHNLPSRVTVDSDQEFVNLTRASQLDRLLLGLYFYEQLTVSEIAVVLQKSETYVDTHLTAAILGMSAVREGAPSHASAIVAVD